MQGFLIQKLMFLSLKSLKDLFVISAKMVSIENIQKTVAEYYNIKLSDLLSKKK